MAWARVLRALRGNASSCRLHPYRWRTSKSGRRRLGNFFGQSKQHLITEQGEDGGRRRRVVVACTRKEQGRRERGKEEEGGCLPAMHQADSASDHRACNAWRACESSPAYCPRSAAVQHSAQARQLVLTRVKLFGEAAHRLTVVSGYVLMICTNNKTVVMAAVAMETGAH
jgi:hypothetical protein